MAYNLQSLVLSCGLVLGSQDSDIQVFWCEKLLGEAAWHNRSEKLPAVGHYPVWHARACGSKP